MKYASSLHLESVWLQLPEIDSCYVFLSENPELSIFVFYFIFLQGPYKYSVIKFPLSLHSYNLYTLLVPSDIVLFPTLIFLFFKIPIKM